LQADSLIGAIPMRSTSMNANAKQPSATPLERVLANASFAAFTNPEP
jgi:hypothetical protein